MEALKKTNDQRNIVISVEGNRLYLSSSTASAISTKIDITPVRDFFKQVIKQNPQLLD